MVLATRVSTNTGHGGNPKLHPSVLSGLKHCGFFPSRILHYFPLSVRLFVCVCTGICHMNHWRVNQSLYIRKPTHPLAIFAYKNRPEQTRPEQQHTAPDHIIKRQVFAKDCLLTGQEQACTLGSPIAIVVWSFGCHHAKNGLIHRKIVVDCPRPDQK